ncbi:MAG TPA: glycoside hydrolase family 38 C-terminal domain-containing protein [Armatimonadota bacterium]|jgi:alpha-mannosidase
MTTPLTTIHLIGQAHIDPIWLWPWQSGLDEVLATCRSACDLLDEYPQFIFTRGEAWSYAAIERADPALFARIRQHVVAERWEIVGGWWIQPDCNLPSGFAFERQLGIGKRYLLDRFGQFPRIGYNVDSFGHAATLPGYLQSAGQDCYIMMRPEAHEMTLPARLFRWRGYDGGPEVTTFRIAGPYNADKMTPDFGHLRHALSALPAGITDTMCFVGVGDHGGGPTETLIRWVIEHEHALEGCRIVFSSPSRFFRAIAAQAATLPLVTGELQHHAIGCYSVHRPIKTAVRQAEHLLYQAELMHAKETPADAATTHRLDEAWERVCFNQFHDTLGGTCIPSAYPQVYAQLGHASAVADDLLQYTLRQKMNTLPDDPQQRVVLYNASDRAYTGYTEFEPWARAPQRLLDEAGHLIPFQLLSGESQLSGKNRLLFRIDMAPGEMRALRLDYHEMTPADAPPLASTHDLTVDTTAAQFIFPTGRKLPFPRLDLIEDRSDNWSHGLDRYAEGPIISPRWHAACVLEDGPLLTASLQHGTIGQSTLQAVWRQYAGEPFVELRLQVHWRERFSLLKMTLPLPSPVANRRDGILGGKLERENAGCERPLRDWTHFQLDDETSFAIVSPDTYALDATPQRVRLTLLRSAILTHHDPGHGNRPDGTVSDQGVHHFRFRFYYGASITTDLLEAHSLMLQRPLLAGDLTRGMPRDARC